MITIDQLLKWRKKYIWDKLDGVARKKGKDYSGDGDTFANIRLVEQTLKMPSEIGVLVRLQDKFIRICNLMSTKEGPAVESESLDDSIEDMINYLSYILALREERKNGGTLPE